MKRFVQFIKSLLLMAVIGVWMITLGRGAWANSGETLYGVDLTRDDRLLSIDKDSAAVEVIGTVGSRSIDAVAFDPSTRLLFGIDWFNVPRGLFTIDPTDASTNFVGDTGPTRFSGLALDPSDGTLYATDFPFGNTGLYMINKATGAASLMGRTGFSFIHSLGFDPTTGVLYGAQGLSPGVGLLITINPTTGVGTFVASTVRLTGIAFDQSGVLYGVDNGTFVGLPSVLYVIDKNTGAASLVGTMDADDIGDIDFAFEDHAVPVPFDIKPQGCPNKINVRSKGKLPTAILGTGDLDVAQIDVASIRLRGIAPIRSSIEDVGTPFEPFTGKENRTDCNDYGSDGLLDLTLKFDTQQIVEALGDVEDGQVVILQLTGALQDGQPIEGEDVAVILKKGRL